MDVRKGIIARGRRRKCDRYLEARDRDIFGVRLGEIGRGQLASRTSIQFQTELLL